MHPDKQPQRRKIGGQAIAAALLVCVPVAVLAALYIWSAQIIRDLQSELAEKQDASARLNLAVVTARQSAVSVNPNENRTLAGDFLAGAQDPIVIAELQNRLRALALSNSIELNSATALPAKMMDANAYIGLRVLVRGQLADIQKLVHAIETTRPLLFIERASLRADSWIIRSADPRVDGAPAMIAELDILGAKLPAEATSLAGAAASAPSVPSEPVAGEDRPRPLPQPGIRGGRRS